VGVSIHVIERRRREIGVRKTLGASVPRVLALLMRESSRPVILGNLIALPLAAIATQTILATFMSRMSGSVLPFVTSLVLTVAVAWLAIGTQAFLAARVKPAEVLRYE
jgi:putative ABC transport system permease protein